MRVFNVGYQGRSLESMCEALQKAGVRRVVDVRAVAWSHRPDFRKGALEASLIEKGIAYVHCKTAGNPFRPRNGKRMSPAACATRFARHLEAHLEIVDELVSLVGDGPAALLCYEAIRSECHRAILLEALLKRRRAMRIVDL